MADDGFLEGPEVTTTKRTTPPARNPGKKPGKRGPKPGTSARQMRFDIKMRVVEAERMLSLQMAHSEIVDRIVQKFSVSDRTARTDIKRAYEKWDSEAVAERPRRRVQLRHTLRRLLQMALKKGDLRAAIAVCDRLARLDGLNEAASIAVKAEVTSTVARMTSEEQRRELDRIFDEYGDSVHGQYDAPTTPTH